MANEDLILEVNNLKTYFPVKRGLLKKTVAHVKAVDGVSLTIKKGETLGLVGESGCGKSTFGRTILRLLEPTSGEVKFGGENIFTLGPDDMRRMRRNMQIIFQDPFSSLNPRMKIAEIIKEPLDIHDYQQNKDDRVQELLKVVGLSSNYGNRYPHEFSGGQRQRIGIARALAVNPQFIICDEPVSALDVSIQAQVINLLEDLQDEFDLTYLFIAHDLSVVKHISDRVAVMYLGKIVELAGKDEIYENPLHPYSKALLSAIPIPDPEFQKERTILEGDVPSPVAPPSGCRFHPRCPVQKKICSREEPVFKEVTNGHFLACHIV
ncbi:MAG: ABC transporter ATP-binding protein [Bacillota bacterium]